jgi:hypothetical protein
MGMIGFIQGISLIISVFLLLFVVDVGRNLANIILFLWCCTMFTPILGIPLYKILIKL